VWHGTHGTPAQNTHLHHVCCNHHRQRSARPVDSKREQDRKSAWYKGPGPAARRRSWPGFTCSSLRRGTVPGGLVSEPGFDHSGKRLWYYYRSKACLSPSCPFFFLDPES
jgi:hypothetical protein